MDHDHDDHGAIPGGSDDLAWADELYANMKAEHLAGTPPGSPAASKASEATVSHSNVTHRDSMTESAASNPLLTEPIPDLLPGGSHTPHNPQPQQPQSQPQSQPQQPQPPSGLMVDAIEMTLPHSHSDDPVMTLDEETGAALDFVLSDGEDLPVDVFPVIEEPPPPPPHHHTAIPPPHPHVHPHARAQPPPPLSLPVLQPHMSVTPSSSSAVVSPTSPTSPTAPTPTTAPLHPAFVVSDVTPAGDTVCLCLRCPACGLLFSFPGDTVDDDKKYSIVSISSFSQFADHFATCKDAGIRDVVEGAFVVHAKLGSPVATGPRMSNLVVQGVTLRVAYKPLSQVRQQYVFKPLVKPVDAVAAVFDQLDDMLSTPAPGGQAQCRLCGETVSKACLRGSHFIDTTLNQRGKPRKQMRLSDRFQSYLNTARQVTFLTAKQVKKAAKARKAAAGSKSRKRVRVMDAGTGGAGAGAGAGAAAAATTTTTTMADDDVANPLVAPDEVELLDVDRADAGGATVVSDDDNDSVTDSEYDSDATESEIESDVEADGRAHSRVAHSAALVGGGGRVDSKAGVGSGSGVGLADRPSDVSRASDGRMADLAVLGTLLEVEHARVVVSGSVTALSPNPVVSLYHGMATNLTAHDPPTPVLLQLWHTVDHPLFQHRLWCRMAVPPHPNVIHPAVASYRDYLGMVTLYPRPAFGCLSSWASSTSPTLATRIACVLDIARGLRHLHAVGLTVGGHINVFVFDDGTAKLVSWNGPETVDATPLDDVRALADVATDLLGLDQAPPSSSSTDVPSWWEDVRRMVNQLDDTEEAAEAAGTSPAPTAESFVDVLETAMGVSPPSEVPVVLSHSTTCLDRLNLSKDHSGAFDAAMEALNAADTSTTLTRLDVWQLLCRGVLDAQLIATLLDATVPTDLKTWTSTQLRSVLVSAADNPNPNVSASVVTALLNAVEGLRPQTTVLRASLADGRVLYAASRRGHAGVIRILTGTDLLKVDAVPADVNAPPLWVAAAEGHTAVLTNLLAAKADVNAVTRDGRTPVFSASASGHMTVVRLLVDYGADVNVPPSHVGFSPLYMACQNGHTPVVKLLLRSSASMNVAGLGEGTTLLAVAHQQGHRDVVDVLVAAKRKQAAKKVVETAVEDATTSGGGATDAATSLRRKSVEEVGGHPAVPARGCCIVM